ncbi:MAG: hypothetical protein JWN32_1207 [Solirubrobacterales bacterium]|nr:hypothetical protein [Solirubrobacterales bacterium]
MSYDRFIDRVQREAGLGRREAERATVAVLQTLGERISGGETRDLARYLPGLLQPVLIDDRDAQRFDADEFLRRVSERAAVKTLATAERHARAVFSALREAVHPKELRDMMSELPKDFDRLVMDGVASPTVAPPDRPVPTAEAIVERVAERAGLDRDQAQAATDAVLETLADRISGGEVDDLEEQLPPELHPPLERGKAESNGAARRMPLDEFIRAIAEREGVTPDEAREHARAVFATLREFVDDKEIGDIAAQLPDDYRALLARP